MKLPRLVIAQFLVEWEFAWLKVLAGSLCGSRSLSSFLVRLKISEFVIKILFQFIFLMKMILTVFTASNLYVFFCYRL